MVYRCGCSEKTPAISSHAWSTVVRPDSILAEDIARLLIVNVFPVVPKKFLMFPDMYDGRFLHPSPITAFGAIYHEHCISKRNSTISIRTVLGTGPPGTGSLLYPDRPWNNPASNSVTAIRSQPRVRNECKRYLHSPTHLRGYCAGCAKSQI
jgi:hypothetical protein